MFFFTDIFDFYEYIQYSIRCNIAYELLIIINELTIFSYNL